MAITNNTISEKQMRLLSLTEASRILRIRRSALSGLVRQGLISSIIVGNRIKIPYYSLENFIQGLSTGKPGAVKCVNINDSSSSEILDKIINNVK